MVFWRGSGREFGRAVGLHKSLNYAISCSQHQQFNGIAFLKIKQISKASGPRLPSLHWSMMWRIVCSASAWSAHVCVRTDCAVCCFTADVLWGCQCDNLGVERGVGGWAGLDKLHVIGWEHSKMAVWAVASPPALIYHLDPGDDVVGIEWDLGVISSLVVI